MEMSRRQNIRFSATAVASLSFRAIGILGPTALIAQPLPEGLSETPLPSLPALPLRPGGSALEYGSAEAGAISGVIWWTKSTPDMEVDYRKMRIRLGRIRHRQTFRHLDLRRSRKVAKALTGHPAAMCGTEPTWHRKVVWSALLRLRGIDWPAAFRAYVRFAGSDTYSVDEGVTTLMHPQVLLAWLLNDEPIPPQHGARFG
jgi:hypothetical protein